MDQRRFDNQHSETLTAKEAARALDVKLSTLYAYKSRGLLTSVPVKGSRARRYLRADIDRLKQRHEARAGHTAVAANALNWGEPVLDTSITRFDAGGLYYRGHSAVELARSGVSFERVAELLWTGVLPESVPAAEAIGAGLPLDQLVALLPPKLSPFLTLAAVVPLLAAHDPSRLVIAPAVEVARARLLTRRLLAMVALTTTPNRVGRALETPGLAASLAVVWGLSPKPPAVDALNAALVLCADHELNPSSFAARTAASTGADLYACISAGLAVMSGPKHGGASERVEALARETGHAGRAKATVQERLERGDDVPGFGHPLYVGGDPRGQLLMTIAGEVGQARNPRRQTLQAIAETVEESHGVKPNLDFGLATLAAALHLPPGCGAAIFALGRTAGWVAHVFEQREAGYILRPRARYVDKSPAAGPGQ